MQGADQFVQLLLDLLGCLLHRLQEVWIIGQADAEFGCSCPVRCLESMRIRAPRRISGSASPRRLVAAATRQLLRSRATLGWSGPYDRSSIANAQR